MPSKLQVALPRPMTSIAPTVRQHEQLASDGRLELRLNVLRRFTVRREIDSPKINIKRLTGLHKSLTAGIAMQFEGNHEIYENLR